MFGLGGLGTKILIGVVLVAIVTSAIGGFWLFQKNQIDNLNATISKQRTTISEQLTTIKIHEASIKELKDTVATERANQQTTIEELARVRESDRQTRKQLNDALNIIRDVEKQEQINRLLKSRRASLVLRLMDKRVECEVENFNRTDGKCIRGRWVKNGERLVPEEPVGDEE